MKAFTIYGHGGDLGHVTWTICTKFSSPFPRRDVPVGVPLDLGTSCRSITEYRLAS